MLILRRCLFLAISRLLRELGLLSVVVYVLIGWYSSVSAIGCYFHAYTLHVEDLSCSLFSSFASAWEIIAALFLNWIGCLWIGCLGFVLGNALVLRWSWLFKMAFTMGSMSLFQQYSNVGFASWERHYRMHAMPS